MYANMTCDKTRSAPAKAWACAPPRTFPQKVTSPCHISDHHRHGCSGDSEITSGLRIPGRTSSWIVDTSGTFSPSYTTHIFETVRKSVKQTNIDLLTAWNTKRWIKQYKKYLHFGKLVIRQNALVLQKLKYNSLFGATTDTNEGMKSSNLFCRFRAQKTGQFLVIPESTQKSYEWTANKSD